MKKAGLWAGLDDRRLLGKGFGNINDATPPVADTEKE